MYPLLLLGVLCSNFAPSVQVCSYAEPLQVCTLQGNPQTVEIADEKIFVGSENSLQVFRLPGLQPLQTLDLSSDEDTVVSCSGFEVGQLGVDVEDCKNFIRTIQRFPNNTDKIMVCGTNAYHPECNVHQISNHSNYRKLSAPGEIDDGYSPNSRTHPIEAIWASNGHFFSATRFNDIGSLTAIRMSPRALENDTAFTVSTPLDDRWLNTPTFVSAHEYGEHIFFFMSEPALELEAVQEVRYSRAVRICKADIGINTDAAVIFLTFQKARMVCSVEGTGRSIPFFYDELVSTFVWQRDSETGAVLYGVFNSPTNGPAGAAICKFSFETINEVFNDRNYLVKMEVDGRSIWGKSTASTFSCPGSSTENQRSKTDVILKFDSITPTQSPLFVSKAEFLDKITAETVDYMGADQEILYFTNQRGDIMQVILSEGEQYKYTVLGNSDSPNPVRDLILHQQENSNERSLIATLDNQIIQIPRGKCSIYADCFSCFDSKDAYCGWNPDSRNCLNKFENIDISTLIQSFSASEAIITATCGERQPPTAAPTDEPIVPCLNKPSTDPNTVEVTSNTDVEGEDCTTKTTIGNSGPETAAVRNEESDSIGIPVVAGASIGAFLLGLSIGSIVCVVLCKRFARSHSNQKGGGPEEPRENAVPAGNETVIMMQVNNVQTTEKENLTNETKLQPVPPPRYVQHGLNKPGSDPPTAVSPTKMHGTLGSTTSLPPMYHLNDTANRHNLPETTEEEEDSAFADNDTLPPLKSFPSPGTMYGSLGRLKTGSNGISRKQIPGHKVPRGRTDSTTWLRQRSESWSSDMSSNTSPLQSPISDV